MDVGVGNSELEIGGPGMWFGYSVLEVGVGRRVDEAQVGPCWGGVGLMLPVYARPRGPHYMPFMCCFVCAFETSRSILSLGRRCCRCVRV